MRGKPSDDRRRAPDVALGERDDGSRVARAEIGGDEVLPGHVADERAVFVDRSLAWRKAPARV